MSGREDSRDDSRPVVYCVIPGDLAAELHGLLRRWFRDQPQVEVVVEQRADERRKPGDRRTAAARLAVAEERRLIRAQTGRRVEDRRAAVVSVDAHMLPRRARPHIDRIQFIERFEPTALALEDADTARLVARFQAGERDAFAELYRRYFARVFSYLVPLVRDRHEAEDAVQNVFMKVLGALPRYERRERPFRAWLFTIVRNEGLMRLRSSARVEVRDPDEVTRSMESEADGDDPAAVLGWISDRELLMFVERLPLTQRQVLMMRFMLELTHTEIASILERTPADVRALQSRALRFLRARLSALQTGQRVRRDVGVLRRTRQATVLRARRFVLTRR
jgi:RNA polymerase sigma-70 factor (ECF subfamily)